jgi:signal peptidase
VLELIMTSAIVCGLLVAVYLVINLALPHIPIDVLIRTYVLQPVLWVLLILAIRFLPGYRPLAKLNTRSTFIWLALGIAFIQIFLYTIGGLYSGFGKNPSSFTALGITENLFFVGSMLIAMELSRAWLVTRLGKRHSFLALAFVALLYTFVSIPLGQITGFRLQIESTNLVASSWVPLLAENLLASLLVLLAGARASLAYRGLLAAFLWLCPILPDLTWALKALIGAAVPIMGMVAVNSVYARQASRGKSRRKARSASFPTGWIVTALVCVIIVWFVVGVFPFQPSLVGSGSMSPALKTGDVVIVAKVQADGIKLGDIIKYRKDIDTTVLHRVISIDETAGARSFITKGDANAEPDTDPVIFENVIGKVVFNVPKVGWISITVKRLFTG